MRKKPLVGAVVGVLAVGTASVAMAGTKNGVTFDSTTTTKAPGSPTGLNTHIQGAPTFNGQLEAARTVTVIFPAGTKINSKAVTQCKATDQAIQSSNGKDCPAKSKIGTGIAEAFTGLGPTIDPVIENIVAFNVPKGIAFLLTPKGAIGQTAAFRGKFSGAGVARVRGAASGPKLLTKVPKFPIPGVGEAKLTKFDLNVKKVGTKAKPYATTPKTCPKSKKWALSAVFTYDNTPPITVKDTSPCK
ncbi:MAG: hypothetical protein ACJ76V_12530 [Thermoleophilaceae bacterium]